MRASCRIEENHAHELDGLQESCVRVDGWTEKSCVRADGSEKSQKSCVQADGLQKSCVRVDGRTEKSCVQAGGMKDSCVRPDGPQKSCVHAQDAQKLCGRKSSGVGVWKNGGAEIIANNQINRNCQDADVKPIVRDPIDDDRIPVESGAELTIVPHESSDFEKLKHQLSPHHAY